jgi:hypothetical protein
MSVTLSKIKPLPNSKVILLVEMKIWKKPKGQIKKCLNSSNPIGQLPPAPEMPELTSDNQTSQLMFFSECYPPPSVLTGLQAVKFNVYEGHFYFLNLQKPNS